jgi:hypothetical protein
MPIYRVEFHYFCAGYYHENHTTKYFRAKNIDDVERRFPAMLTCAYCEPGTFIGINILGAPQWSIPRYAFRSVESIPLFPLIFV